MIALIDSDTLAYASAATAENENEQIARWNVNKMVENILRSLNTSDYKCYVTGDSNFRYSVYPEYKANRLKMVRPKYLAVCKQHLVDEWGAQVSQGCEADDDIGVDALSGNYIDPIVVSIDKDMDQVWGKHYNPRKELEYYVTPNDALRFFYYQLLVGDTADNIKGAPGIGPKKATKILDGVSEESELLQRVEAHYPSTDALEMNGKVLWIFKQPNDIWKMPVFDQEI